MEGTPENALHLIRAGATFAAAKRFRHAAFYYFAASRYPGVGPIVKARALLEAASFIFESLQSPTAYAQGTNLHKDRVRASQWLQTAGGLLKNKPNTFHLRMKVASLLDNVFAASADHQNAARVIRIALRDVTNSRDVEPAEAMKWWVYFRSREIIIATEDDRTVPKALQRATTTAIECVRLGDPIAATGFHLARCQIALGLPVVPDINVQTLLTEAQQCLNSIDPRTREAISDNSFLRFAYFLMATLACIREGNVDAANSTVANDLRKSFSDLRQARRAGNLLGMWKWIPIHLLPPFTVYALAVFPTTEAKSNPIVLLSKALEKLGISLRYPASFNPRQADVNGLSSDAFNLVSITMLERAARLKMRSLDLKSAVDMINITVKLAFRDNASRAQLANIERQAPFDAKRILPGNLKYTALMSRSAVLLLCAEYHILRGRISGAHIATELVKLVLSIPTRFENHYGHELVSDAWQMAQSHLSLLEGECRPALITSSTHNLAPSNPKSEPVDVRFASKHVLAAAWFVIAIYHVRKSDVLEARRAADIAGELLRTSSNEQVLANSMITQSSMVMTHEMIGDEAEDMLKVASRKAEAIDDPLTQARIKRQYRKLLVRMGYGEADIDAARSACSVAINEMYKRQDAARATILSEAAENVDRRQ